MDTPVQPVQIRLNYNNKFIIGIPIVILVCFIYFLSFYFMVVIFHFQYIETGSTSWTTSTPLNPPLKLRKHLASQAFFRGPRVPLTRI